MELILKLLLQEISIKREILSNLKEHEKASSEANLTLCDELSKKRHSLRIETRKIRKQREKQALPPLEDCEFSSLSEQLETIDQEILRTIGRLRQVRTLIKKSVIPTEKNKPVEKKAPPTLLFDNYEDMS